MKYIKSIISIVVLLFLCIFRTQAGPLHNLVQTGSVEKVCKLLTPIPFFSYFSPPPDINEEDELGRTALQIVCKAEGDRAEMAQLLLDKGADCKKALHFACEKGNIEIIKLLLYKGEDINFTTKSGETPFHCACKNNNLDVINLLLKKGANLNLKTGPENCDLTALHFACNSNSIKVIEFLINKKVDPDPKSKGNYTPLHYACDNNNFEIVKLLIEKGAKPNTRSNDRYLTPLHYALKNNRPGAIKNSSPEVLKSDSLKIIQLLIEKGVDLNLKCEGGRTVLHTACKENGPEIVALFLQHKADPNIQSANGQTALDIIRSTWTIEQIIELFELLVPFKARNKESIQDKFFQFVLKSLATEFKNGSILPTLSPENSLFDSQDVENHTVIIKTVESFLKAFFGSRQPDYVMPKNMLSERELTICQTLCTKTPFQLAVKHLYNLAPYQLNAFYRRLKFAQAAYGQYVNATNNAMKVPNDQQQLVSYKRFQDINVWFKKDERLFNLFVRSCKKKPSVALLNSFLKNGRQSLSDPDKELKSALFKALLSRVGNIVKADEKQNFRLRDFVQKLNLNNEK
ncbi:TPA: hypothetical protein DDZ86_01815 [Candidatus Dependentiae bacterium]|nr:MAG: hypothetical protein UW09_C0001G0274 [candidate division TM6 bacterium GW2011_GWF2_43_87]HBL98361.1 hypothetical protein [Candidatus Dependentiae bacterium]